MARLGASALAARLESEAYAEDVKPPTAKIQNDAQMGSYEPFSDPDVEFDVTKWPTKKAVPSTVTAWDPKTSSPAGTVKPDTTAPAKEKQ